MGLLCSCFVRSPDEKKDPLSGDSDTLTPVKIQNAKIAAVDNTDPLMNEEPPFLSNQELNSTITS